MKELRRYVLLILAVMASVLSLCGCSASSKAAPGEKAADLKPEDGKNLYVIATVLSGLHYFDEYRSALAVAEEEMNVSTALIGPEDYNLEELITTIHELIDAGNTYGLILLGWEDALVPAINRAVDSGMYVCTVCQDLPESGRMMYVGQDNYAAGETLADIILKAYPEEADVVVLRSMSLTNVSERIRGLDSVISEYPGHQIIAEIDTKNDMKIALQKADSLWDKYPDADVIIAADGISSAALAQRIRGSGMGAGKGKDKPLIICFDSEEDVLREVKKGTVDCTIVSHAPLEVYLAIAEGERVYHSDLQLSADDRAAHVQLGVSHIDTGYTVVTAENVDYFL